MNHAKGSYITEKPLIIIDDSIDIQMDGVVLSIKKTVENAERLERSTNGDRGGKAVRSYLEIESRAVVATSYLSVQRHEIGIGADQIGIRDRAGAAAVTHCSLGLHGDANPHLIRKTVGIHYIIWQHHRARNGKGLFGHAGRIVGGALSMPYHFGLPFAVCGSDCHILRQFNARKRRAIGQLRDRCGGDDSGEVQRIRIAGAEL